jgi:murein L,D-transpeptidase YcbB/YkuD
LPLSLTAIAALWVTSLAAPRAFAIDTSPPTAAEQGQPAGTAPAIALDPHPDTPPATVPGKEPAAANTTTPCLDTALERFYRRRNGDNAWVARAGGIHRRTADVLEELEHADKDALDPQRYHVAELRAVLERQGHDHKLTEAEIDALDARITTTVLTYAHDLAAGRVDPAHAEVAGRRSNTDIDTAAVLEQGIEARDVRAALSSLAPTHQEYVRLRDALPRYRAIVAAGGWPQIDTHEKLEPGRRYSPELLDAFRIGSRPRNQAAHPRSYPQDRSVRPRPLAARSHTTPRWWTAYAAFRESTGSRRTA